MKKYFGKISILGMCCFIISMFFTAAMVDAKTYRIKGKIKPKIEGVKVEIYSKKLSEPIVVTTSEKGKFKVADLERGKYMIFPSYEGYNFRPSAKTVKLKENKKIKFKAIKAYSGDIIALHDKKSSAFREDCTSSECHEGILTGVTLKKKINKAHLVGTPPHIYDFEPGEITDQQCRYCHKKTDVLTHSAQALRQNTDPTLCADCHGPDGPGKQFYQVSD